MVLAAPARGGILCRSLAELGAPAQPLTYSDEAPTEGYAQKVTLDFAQDQAAVCFVRTRDGQHYAKFAYTPQSFAARSQAQLQRDVMFRYVYNPSGGGSSLDFQEEGPNPTCGDPWY